MWWWWVGSCTTLDGDISKRDISKRGIFLRGCFLVFFSIHLMLQERRDKRCPFFCLEKIVVFFLKSQKRDIFFIEYVVVKYSFYAVKHTTRDIFIYKRDIYNKIRDISSKIRDISSKLRDIFFMKRF